MSPQMRVVYPLVRRSIWGLAGVVLALLLASVALWGVRHFLAPDWQRAQSAMQEAQNQLEEIRSQEADVQAHGTDYAQLVAAGFVGGEPRAAWVEDLMNGVQTLGLQSRIGFTLAPPEVLPLDQAEAAQAQVQRHVLQWELVRVHDIEALRLVALVQARYKRVSRLDACTFEQPGTEGLTARCRVNFLHIDPVPGADNNAKP